MRILKQRLFGLASFRLVVLLVVVLLLTPGIFLAQDKSVQLFAHRGGAHEQDENTLEAFRSSFEKGLRGFETDVRLTSDGALVIMHDASLERTTIGSGIVEKMTAAEIRSVRTKKNNAILFLDELLEFLNEKPGLYVEFEMKTNPAAYPEERLQEYCDKLYQAVIEKKPRESTYLLTSFDKRPLRYIKSKYPKAGLLFITSSPLTKDVIQQTLELGVGRVGCNLGGTSRSLVKEAQAEGILVSCWPGHTVEDFLLGLYLGCDYLCSDVPGAVLTFMNHQMPWVKVK
jgi:glycerophosphoryl diester phosphodiesterase